MTTQFTKIVKKIGQSLLFIMAAGLLNPSYAEQVNPQLMLEKVTKATFARIELDQQMIESTPEHLRQIIDEELMPYIDHQFAAFKVLGSQFRAVPKDKIPEFVDEFKQYLISDFAVALANYGGQELVFEPAKDFENQKDMTVKAIIRKAGNPDINIQFKLRKSRQTQEWKAYDLVAEGISLLSSKQSEFASLIRQQGIQAVIDVMKEKNSQGLIVASNTK